MSKARAIAVAGATAIVLAAVAAVAMGATANLSVDKTDSADPVPVGTEFHYTVTVANAGPEPATGVQLTDDLPKHVSLVAATATQGSCKANGGKVTCELGTLAADGNASATLRVVAKRAGQLVNQATVTSADVDPSAADDSDSETTTVIETNAPTCGGRTATVVGTGGNDQLTGTKKADVIAALRGDDRVFGLDGNDVVCGNGGADFIKGRAGDDLLRGGGGNDTLGGGPGDDTLRGGTGRDSCRGGPGSDTKRSCP